ncbi:MAG TPA: DUF1161 domain-containing protein [Burkholderiaceae bacterium]|nr:DUF1161 domain-containing protein [Burkholderiaceae bacterium]HSB99101.1 DUF1161 domain-containing protein [Burkholderiaceae bacterium]
MNLRKLAVLAAGCAAAVPAFAIGCDELQQTIEARIRGNGVASFTVTAVDAAASAPGQVVGTCDGGRKKLLYVRGTAAPATAPAASAPAASSSDPVRTSSPAVITECADGRVITDGSCKK